MEFRRSRKISNGHWWAEDGFTLLESLMAAVVLGIGLIGLAGMQGIALSRNVDANELTLASNLAADMVERIQYNRRNAIVYNNIDTTLPATQPTTNTMASGAPQPCGPKKFVMPSGCHASASATNSTAIAPQIVQVERIVTREP